MRSRFIYPIAIATLLSTTLLISCLTPSLSTSGDAATGATAGTASTADTETALPESTETPTAEVAVSGVVPGGTDEPDKEEIRSQPAPDDRDTDSVQLIESDTPGESSTVDRGESTQNDSRNGTESGEGSDVTESALASTAPDSDSSSETSTRRADDGADIVVGLRVEPFESVISDEDASLPAPGDPQATDAETLPEPESGEDSGPLGSTFSTGTESNTVAPHATAADGSNQSASTRESDPARLPAPSDTAGNTSTAIPNETTLALASETATNKESQTEPADSIAESAPSVPSDSTGHPLPAIDADPVADSPSISEIPDRTDSGRSISEDLKDADQFSNSIPTQDQRTEATPADESSPGSTEPISDAPGATSAAAHAAEGAEGDSTPSRESTIALASATEPTERIFAADENPVADERPEADPEADPGADQEPAPLPPPAREPLPLSEPELLALAVASLPDTRRPISTTRGFISVYNDFDADGLMDISIVSVEPPSPADSFRSVPSRSGDAGRAEENDTDTDGTGEGEDLGRDETDFPIPTHFSLSNPVRLFASEIDSYVFYLGTYLQRSGVIELYSEDLIGNYVVFDGIEIVPIVESESMPAALVATFQTRQGSIDEWVVFSSAGITRLTLRERIGSRNTIDDIDDDGVLDIVLADESFEVGIGFETYLSWLKWSGTGFELSASANVVRSVHAFLSSALEALEAGAYSQFGTFIGPEASESVWTAGDARERIFGEVFRLLPSPSGFANRAIERDEAIRRIIHAEILENPFSQSDEFGDFFPLTFRFETEAGSVHLYGAILYMSRNPFTDRQFFFAPNARR